MKAVLGILAVFVQFPIWCYLLYKMMLLTGATELMWFLFWIYVPVGLLNSAIANALRKMAK